MYHVATSLNKIRLNLVKVVVLCTFEVSLLVKLNGMFCAKGFTWKWPQNGQISTTDNVIPVMLSV